MPITPPQNIDLLPEAPSRLNAPDVFIERADTWVNALPTFGQQVDTLGQQVYEYALETEGTATAAIFAANATAWVSGFNYAEGQVVWSPSNKQTYRRNSPGWGAMDPADGDANWTQISGGGGGGGLPNPQDRMGVLIADPSAMFSVMGNSGQWPALVAVGNSGFPFTVPGNFNRSILIQSESSLFFRPWVAEVTDWVNDPAGPFQDFLTPTSETWGRWNQVGNSNTFSVGVGGSTSIQSKLFLGSNTVTPSSSTLSIQDGATSQVEICANNLPRGYLTAAGNNFEIWSNTYNTTLTLKVPNGAGIVFDKDRVRFIIGGTTVGPDVGFLNIPIAVAMATPGRMFPVTAAVTVPIGAGELTYGVYNDSSVPISLSPAGGLTMRKVGTNTTGALTLAPRGMAFFWYRDANQVIVSGAD